MEEPPTNGDKRNPDGTFAEGNPGGPGRPVGSISIIGKIKQIWENEPEKFESYVKDVMEDKMLRREIIQQVDGRPPQVIKGDKDAPLVFQLVNYGDTKQLPT